MWFSLFATVLILAITFYEGLQGLFTSVINCVLAVLAAALAFGLYEDLYFNVLHEYQPDHGRAIALMSIFVVSLLVLRTLFDALIQGNLHFPIYVDRAGGGIFGFITGMIVVGMLSIGFEMLPFGDSVLGFARMELVDKNTNEPVPPEEMANTDPANLTYVRHGSWLGQERFTVALVSHLSDNALAGRNSFKDVYPDFVGHAYHSRARMGEDMQLTADPKMNFNVEGYRELRPREFYARQQKTENGKTMVVLVPAQDPASGKRIAVRVAMGTGKHKFTSGQFRLVAKDNKSGRVTEHLLAGINDAKAGNRLVEVYDGEILSRELDGKSNRLDLVFEVPQGIEFGEGSFIEYKQNVRAAIRPADEQTENRPALLTASAGGQSSGGTQGAGSATANNQGPRSTFRPGTHDGTTRDRVSGIAAGLKDSRISNELPFMPAKLMEYGGNAQVVNGEYRGGQLLARLDNDWQPLQGNKPPVERFQVPPDMRLMQISVEKLHPGSTLGKALDFTRTTLNDYKLVDQNGREHMLVGMWAMAIVNGQPTFEATYLDETARQDGAVFARVRPFQTIRKDHLVGQYAFFYLYQVPVGTKAMKVRTGRTDVDLSGLNLVAQ